MKEAVMLRYSSSGGALAKSFIRREFASNDVNSILTPVTTPKSRSNSLKTGFHVLYIYNDETLMTVSPKESQR